MKMNFDAPPKNENNELSKYSKMTREEGEEMIKKICATSDSEEEVKEKIKLLGVEKDFVVSKLGTGNSVGIVMEYPDGIELLRKNFTLKEKEKRVA